MRSGASRTGRTLLAVITGCILLLGLLAPAASAENSRSLQWYIDAMQAPSMWEISDGAEITVAVIDGKVDPMVPELRSQVLAGKDFSMKAQRDPKRDVHATNMAILIAGKHEGGGPWGLAPASKILPLTTGGPQGLTGVTKAIRYAAQHGAHIINISLTGIAFGENRRDLQDAINYANDKGSLILAGTGNHGDEDNTPAAPANMPGVVGVGAIDKSLKVADFSAYGPHVGLTAPGVDIPTRCEDDAGYCISDGTSAATAIASASAALIWSKHPDWTNNQVLRVLMETAGKPTDGEVPSKYLGYGVVRPNKVLLDNEGNPGPPDVNPLFPDYNASEPSTSPSPSTEERDTSLPPEGDRTHPPSEHQATDSDSDGVPLWLIVSGATVGLAAASGATYALLRRRQSHH